jgi:transcriptional regulator with XRE-family HTH domain
MHPEQEKAAKEAGERLKAIRTSAGMSQEDVAFDANLDQSTLSKVERVGPHIVSWSKLLAVAEALDCVVEVSFRRRGS